MTRYKLLGCPGQENIEECIEVTVSAIPKRKERLRTEQRLRRYESILNSYFTIVQYKHFGFPITCKIQEIVDSACAYAMEYYLGHWTIAKEQELARVAKEESNEDFCWFRLFQYSIQFALLNRDKELLSVMGEYIEPWFHIDPFYPHEISPLYAHLLLSVSSSFRKIPINDFKRFEHETSKNRDKVVASLFKAWEAAEQGNPAEFNDSLHSSLAQFERKLDRKLLFSRQAIAEYHSIVFNAASTRGVEAPKFEPKTMARLLTRESIGLE